jgi:hypothetical protein
MNINGKTEVQCLIKTLNLRTAFLTWVRIPLMRGVLDTTLYDKVWIRRKTDITKMAKKKQEMKTNNGRQNTTEKTKDWAT